MKKVLLSISVVIILKFLCANLNMESAYAAETMDFTEIDSYVEEMMEISKIPGISMVFIDEGKSYFRTYGYADSEQSIPMKSQYLFELGSMSKAFTALGVFLLEDEGLISLEDSVTKYLPWFEVYYKGRYEGHDIDGIVDLTIEDLIYHTSGIPFETVGYIPSGETDDMLEQTVRNLVGSRLDFHPSERYQYATVNYDILGLIIQEVSGQSYESFILEEILQPLGLYNTYMTKEDAVAQGKICTGYKLNFFNPVQYDAPIFRGNTPAGYIISNAVDMERWMKLQMGLIEDIPEQYIRIIEKSHEPDTTVAAHGYYFYYGGGWNIYVENEKEIHHGGNNPNYSSMMVLIPERNTGICVLSNMNSTTTDYIAVNALSIFDNRILKDYEMDFYQKVDIIFSIIIIAAIGFICVFFALLVKAAVELVKKRRRFIKAGGAKVVGMIVMLPLIVFLWFCVYYLPNVMFQRIPWTAVYVWASTTVPLGSWIVFGAITLFLLYVLLTFNAPKENEKNYLVLVILSLLNGVSSALIIFTINESFNRNMNYSKELFVYFIFSILFFVYTLKLLQGKLIFISNEIAYENRIKIINYIMRSSFQKVEAIGRDRIYSGLNNDCGAIGQIPGIIVNFASNLLTVIFCLCYLYTKSRITFGLSVGIIIINGFFSVITSRLATKYWEKNRDVQETFFDQMNDLIYGFKELVLNKNSRRMFTKDVYAYSRLSTDLNKKASIKFLNFSLYNTLMYNLVFGIVVFIVPFIIRLETNDVRENLFIVFYLIGPFNSLINVIPELTKTRVNFRRIHLLIDDLKGKLKERNRIMELEGISKNMICSVLPVTIKLDDVVFEYTDMNLNQEGFKLGPLNLEFKSDEITFITGGNGSGKSTLARLLTGLYNPISGTITVNGEVAYAENLNNLFSAVFSDFHLFKKLYGINIKEKRKKINWYLDLMKISDKVQINDNGAIGGMQLSTGQKKRLAFVISCLEDKGMLLFDEWAAEQDIEFRHFFYNELLPMLHAQGKGIVVITHDDRYFELAEKLIVMNRGEIEKIV